MYLVTVSATPSVESEAPRRVIVSTSVHNLWSEAARIHKMQDFKQLVPLAVAILGRT